MSERVIRLDGELVACCFQSPFRSFSLSLIYFYFAAVCRVLESPLALFS